MKTNQGGKFTKMKLGFVKILDSYKVIRKLIHKLTNFNFHHINDIDPLISDAQSVDKLQERQIQHYTELLLVHEVQNKLKNYLNKNYLKMKKYDLYSHVVCFLDVILSKINQFVPKNIQICRLTPQMMRWKLFLSELNEAKVAMNIWFKETSSETTKSRSEQHKMSFYKISTTKETKANTPSTAYMSMVETPQIYITEKQEREEKEEKKETRRFQFLKRSQSTGKTQIGRNLNKKRRTQYQLKKRSPQSQGIINLNDLGSENSIYSPKFVRKANKSKLFYRIDENSKFDGIMEITKLGQGNEKCRGLLKKASIVVETQQDQNRMTQQHTEENDDFPSQKMQALQLKYESVAQSKKLERNQRRTSIRKIKLTQIQAQPNKSSFALSKVSQIVQETQNKKPQALLDEILEQSQTVIFESGEKLKLHKRGKNNKKINLSFDPDIPEKPQSQNALKQKQKKTTQFKILLQSFKVQPTNILTITQQASKKPTNEKKKVRRIGIINSKQMVSVLSRLQTKIRQEEKERELELKKKTIEMNERLIEELSIAEDTITHDDQKTIIKQEVNKRSFNELYRELARLKIDQIKESKTNPWGQESSFFIVQDLLREEKSRQLQEYVQKLQMNNRTVGEVFLIKSEEENVKMQKYMMMERKLAFQSENQWIKSLQKVKLDSLDSVQLIQHKSSSQTPYFHQNF